MISSQELKTWFGNIGGDIWGGLVTTFALLPETIGFMLAVGVPPYLGLYTCICLTIVLAFTGGRPGVITAGAGSTAMILLNMVARYWDSHPEYIFAAVVLAGIIQFILGVFRFGNLVKYLPQCVMNGFVNGLAILIFISQVKLILRDLSTVTEMLILVAAGLAIIICLPLIGRKVKFINKVPSSLIAIILITLYVFLFKRPVLTIADLGAIAPNFTFVGSVFRNAGNIFTGECFSAIWSVGLSIAFIGIIETMLTCRVVTEETATPELENLNRECRGQGIGNVICGFFGAMPGCAMIGQTKVNMASGGRGRLSSFTAGIVLCILLFFVNPVLGIIPIAALVAVMLKACYDTFSWESVFKCGKLPLKDTMTMVLTVLIVVVTSNLAYGVGAGIILYAALYGLEKTGGRQSDSTANHVVCILISLCMLAASVVLFVLSITGIFSITGTLNGMFIAAVCGIVSIAVLSVSSKKIIPLMIIAGALSLAAVVLMYVI